MPSIHSIRSTDATHPYTAVAHQIARAGAMNLRFVVVAPTLPTIEDTTFDARKVAVFQVAEGAGECRQLGRSEVLNLARDEQNMADFTAFVAMATRQVQATEALLDQLQQDQKLKEDYTFKKLEPKQANRLFRRIAEALMHQTEESEKSVPRREKQGRAHNNLKLQICGSEESLLRLATLMSETPMVKTSTWSLKRMVLDFKESFLRQWRRVAEAERKLRIRILRDTILRDVIKWQVSQNHMTREVENGKGQRYRIQVSAVRPPKIN